MGLGQACRGKAGRQIGVNTLDCDLGDVHTWTHSHYLMRQGPENYAARYYQPKIGHGAVGIFLGGVKFIETFECSSCGAQEQRVVHLYTHTVDGSELENWGHKS